MKKKGDIHAVELVRQIRDKQAKLLEGKSDKEIIDFFYNAAATSKKRSRSQSSETANKRMQPTTRKARRG